MITYKQESIEKVLVEGFPLLMKHWDEIALYKESVKLSVDNKRYMQLENAGVLYTLVCRDNGRMIGYFVAFIQPHLHYQDNIFSAMDVMYIEPDYRNKGIGKELISTAEQDLRNKGVEILLIHVKTSNKVGLLLDSMGYSFSEATFTKNLGEI